MMIFIYAGAGLSSVYNFMDKPTKDGNLRVIYTPSKASSLYLSQIISGTILATMGILFSMLVCTIFKDKASASMSGSAICMITCLLGGCLINIVDNNKIIGTIRDLIPHKRLKYFLYLY